MKSIDNFYKDKIILVTGGAGSIGSHLVRRLLDLEPKVIRVLDNNETGLFDLEEELQSEKIRSFIGDIRDEERLKRALEGVNIVFHAAALKHVPLCEHNPFDAVKTNVLGTQNLMDAALERDVDKVILISTDKAVNPTNVMGATKLLAERLTISSNYYKGNRNTIFSCVRFGNVLNSRGSVVPLFKKQIEIGETLTLTDADMTRFIMSIPRAVDLILKAAEIAEGGEIFILKMPVIRIGDLAEVMVDTLAPLYGHDPNDIEIKMIGKRSGEKLYEKLMTEEEAENVCEGEDMLVILPTDIELLGKRSCSPISSFSKTEKMGYSSRNAQTLTKKEIISLLDELSIK
jgi:FlaA1/EpsC-like NDP-sugar epimerase